MKKFYSFGVMLFLSAFLFLPAMMSAQTCDFEVDGFYYNITSEANKTVEVTNPSGGELKFNQTSDYSGDVTFPATVTHNGQTYAVKSIGSYAFVSSYDVKSVTIPASVDTLKVSSIAVLYIKGENGEVLRADAPEKWIPKVIIESGNTTLVGYGGSISAREVYVDRDIKYELDAVWVWRTINQCEKLVFGDNINVVNPYLVYGNTDLKEVRFPNHKFTFGLFPRDKDADNFYSCGVFEHCSSLERVDLSNLVPALSYYVSYKGYEEQAFGLDEKTYQTSYLIPPHTFRGCTSLKEVILPASVDYVYNKADGDNWNISLRYRTVLIGDGAFQGCTSLESFSFPTITYTTTSTSSNKPAPIVGHRAFCGCTALKSLEVPSTIAYLGSFAYADCSGLESVKLPSEWAFAAPWKEANDDYNTYVDLNNISSYFLCDGVFKNCSNLKTFDVGAVRHIHDGVLEGCANVEKLILNNVATFYPSGLKSKAIKSISLSANNTKYKLENSILKTTDGTQWLLAIGNPYAGNKVISDSYVTTLFPSIFEGLPIESYSLPSLTTIGKRAFANTNITSANVNSSINYGDETFADCLSLTQISLDADVSKLPVGMFKNCTAYTLFTDFSSMSIQMLPYELLYGTQVSKVKFGKSMTIVCENALPVSMEEVTLLTSTPPIVKEDDAIDWITNTTLFVPSGCETAYANHLFWGRAKSIQGLSDYVGDFSGAVTKIPDGLYFAERNGNICYYDGTSVVKTTVNAGSHAFQLAAWNGILFGVDAGMGYKYEDQPFVGDGQLFMVNKHADFGFSKTTVINNISLDSSDDFSAFTNDPYTLYIDSKDGMMYFAGRSLSGNDGIRTIKAADAKELLYWKSDEASLFLNLRNHPYYNKGVMYGALNRGFYKDSQGCYWHACGYNGDGIYRFYDDNLENPSDLMPERPIEIGDLTAMYLDEQNDYIYIHTLGGNNGVYRMKISAIRNGEDTTFPREWDLIDNSEVDGENDTTAEQVGIRQFAGDGNYVYWCYNAEPDSGFESGIKRVNATGTPTVEYVVKGVEGYGICYYNHEVAGVTTIAEASNEAITVSGSTIKALQNTKVEIYAINGTLVSASELSAGSTMTLNCAPGMYIVKATNTVKKILVK